MKMKPNYEANLQAEYRRNLARKGGMGELTMSNAAQESGRLMSQQAVMAANRNAAMRNKNATMQMQAALKQGLPSYLAPGNVGHLSQVIWPFWFTVPAPELVPGSSLQSSFSVSLEASFIWMTLTKVIFYKSGTDYVAIDPDQEDNAVGEANDLTFSVRDSLSSRVLTGSQVPIDMVGHPRFPTVLPTPVMVLPNGNLEVFYANQSSRTTYVPWLTFFGYRVRIQDQEQIVSLVQD
jgi:hypothetical protein